MAFPGGKPLTVVAGTNQLKSKRSQDMPQFTVDDFEKLQCKMDAPDSAMHDVMQTVRDRMGRNAIAPGANKELVQTGYRLESFFDVKRIPLEVKKRQSRRKLRYANDCIIILICMCI